MKNLNEGSANTEDYHKVIALIKNQGDIMRRYEVE